MDALFQQNGQRFKAALLEAVEMQNKRDAIEIGVRGETVLQLIVLQNDRFGASFQLLSYAGAVKDVMLHSGNIFGKVCFFPCTGFQIDFRMQTIQ